MTTDIVILNWNGRDFLEKYLPSVISSIEGLDGVRLVVADNGSTDGSQEMMSEKFPGIKFLPLSKNYGFAEGYNRALSQLEADCFLLLNSDVEVPNDWFLPLQEWMELHPDCGVCGPKLHQFDDRERFEYAGAAGGYIDSKGFPFCRGRIMKMTELDEGQYDTAAEVLWVSGAAMMVRSSLYFSLGGLCGDFFAHMEEIDFCWRARLDGWKVNVVPRSTVYHIGGGSLPQESPYKLFLNYRNNLLMLSRCLPRTLATDFLFNILGRVADRDEGPDMYGNCCSLYDEESRKFRKEICEAAAMLAINRTETFIRRRMIIDGLSAAVYLLKGKKDYVRAVLDAHREFKKMRKKSSAVKLRHYLEDIISGNRLDIARTILTDNTEGENLLGDTFALKGMWSKWMVWQALIRKEKVFDDIRNLI